MEVSNQLHASTALIPAKKKTRHTSNRRVGGPHGRSGSFEKQNKKKTFATAITWTPDRPAHSLITILTELSLTFSPHALVFF